MNLNDLKKTSTFRAKPIVPIVGIGTTAPGAKLDVNGTAKVNASYEGAAATATSGAAYSIPDLSKNVVRLTLNSNTTITLPATSTVPADSVYTLTVRVSQDATGGRTLSWASGTNTIVWDNGMAPAPATGINKRTIYQFTIIGGETEWYGSMVWKEN